MTSLISYSNKFVLILILALIFFPNFAYSKDSKEIGKENVATKKERMRVAVFPLENLSRSMAPVKEIRQMFIKKLRANGFDVLDEGTLELFMAKYRIRYTGGINREIAKALKQEVGTDGVLITTLELYNEASPPKISFISRLVSTGDNPTISWIDGVGLAGDDARGLLDLGLIEDPKILLEKGMKLIFDSLNRYLSTGTKVEAGDKLKRKFRPKIFYRSLALDPQRKYKVVIAPLFNLSGRKYAGDIMVLHLAKGLDKIRNLDVIEMGMVRQTFLELRIIMDQGISLTQADAVLATLNADLIVSGDVTDYDDYQGGWGKPKVGFNIQLIAKKGREVVWSSNSYNEGDDGVFFFDLGEVNTAHAMASQMTRWIAEKIQ
jgi:hypothetical protein